MTVEQLSGLLSAAAEQAAARLDAVAGKMRALADVQPVRLTVDTAQAEERIAALRHSAGQLLTDLRGNQASASALAGAQRNYDRAIEQLDTLKSLSRVTYEQELEYLRVISENMRKYGLRTQDALDLEQRLLSVQQQITQRDAQRLDTLLAGMTSALAGRYQAMWDAELTLLSQSREAWKTWQDNAADAIQAQIDALDQLSEAEDRAAQEEEHLRRIEKLKQALLYERDAFNHEQLTTQLEDAQAAYEGWLTETAREDEKAALQAQISAVNEKAQAEMAALDVQAEAEKQLMTEVYALLHEVPNLYFVPVALTHDSANNFASTQRTVNPRAAQTETVQTETVHPMTQGYMQFADIIYSTIAAHQ